MTRIATIEKADFTQVIEKDATGRTLRRLGSIRAAYADGTPLFIITSYITRQRWTVNVERDVAIDFLARQAR